MSDNKQKYIVFLQNAWSPYYAGSKWPRRSWLKALASCKSGKKLQLMVDDLNVVYNTTEEVGAHASSICKPDLAHMKRIIKKTDPKFIIACGKQAEEAINKIWEGDLFVVPHPACRWLTNAAYEYAGEFIKDIPLNYRQDGDKVAKLRLWQVKGETFKIHVSVSEDL